MIDKFDGKYEFLSNFFLGTVIFENMSFLSVEHAYQSAKTTDPLIRRSIQVLRSPGAAKRVGNSIPIRPDWENIKVPVMRDLLRFKFSYRMELAEQLKDTSPERLVEGNKWHDNFWGICKCPKCPGTGFNMLGQLLMERRAELKRLDLLLPE